MRMNRWLGLAVGSALTMSVTFGQLFEVRENVGPSNAGGSVSYHATGPTRGIFTHAEWVLTDTSPGGAGNGWGWQRDVVPYNSSDPWGRLVLRFSGGGSLAAGNGWRLPSNRSGGMTGWNTASAATFTTWVDSGHFFRTQQGVNDFTVLVRAQVNDVPGLILRVAPTASISGIPDHDQTNPGFQVNKFVNPTITINWSVSDAQVSRDRVLGGAYFDAINSPFRDDAYLVMDFKINGRTVQAGSSSRAIFGVGEGPATKSIGAGNSYVLNLSPYRVGDIVTVRVDYILHWDGYRDMYAGTLDVIRGFQEVQFQVVPEPASMLALGTGLISLISLRRRKR